MGQDAEWLLKGRYQIINVWRPIKTIRKDPLGVADATSVDDEDLVPVQLVYPDRVGETFTVVSDFLLVCICGLKTADEE